MTSPYRQVADAASAFESRWTLRALQRVDPELAALLNEQERLWGEALVTGSEAEIEEQTAAMCRGWAKVTARMQDEPDDAYLIGADSSGRKVAIGNQRAAMARVRKIHGEAVCWLTPDEVATLFYAQQELAKIKGAFPGAEVIELYPQERRLGDVS
jgi:hypothetical protein